MQILLNNTYKFIKIKCNLCKENFCRTIFTIIFIMKSEFIKRMQILQGRILMQIVIINFASQKKLISNIRSRYSSKLSAYFLTKSYLQAMFFWLLIFSTNIKNSLLIASRFNTFLFQFIFNGIFLWVNVNPPFYPI